MFDNQYRRRLTEDLPVWQEKGWVSAGGADAILASLEEKSRGGFGLAAVVAVLGALLLGFGVFALVSANWDYMPRLFRFGLLVAGIAAAYGVAAVLEKRDYPKLAEAAVLLGSLVFAGAIALVGQTYHLAGEFADAVHLWLAGALIAAWATRSVCASVAATAGAAYWIWLVIEANPASVHWGGLIAVLLCGGLSVFLDSRTARHCSILLLGFWIVMTGIVLAKRHMLEASDVVAVFAALGLMLWSAGLVLMRRSPWPRLARLGLDLQLPALAGFLASAAALQIALDAAQAGPARGQAIALAAAALAVALGLAAWAWQAGALRAFDVAAAFILGGAVIGFAAWAPENEVLVRLVGGIVVVLIALWWVSLGHEGHITGARFGLLAFAAEVLYLYSVTLGNLLDTALAFFAGGILFIGLAFVLVRLNKRLAPPRVAS